MRCPYCGQDTLKVVDSRPVEEGNSIRRRRECENCRKRFTTYEKIEQINLIVVKKDNTREFFDREKLLKGIVRSCEKRPISIQTMEEIVSEIERELTNRMQQEIASAEIGELVMEKLKEIDEVSYVRFASVYRQFKDVNSFFDELKKIIKDKEN
ncbi:MAG: transcriptional regulator NrdR [Peptostreptococcaceae bacterium]|nr:transcriptional regulator NrdR [Peptostreptococcaceae bacterium]